MNKREFIESLRAKLSGLPKQELEERLAFYGEMIEDRKEEGLTEEQAVAAIGSVDEVSAQIIGDIPLTKIAKERLKPKKRLRAWEIVLIVLGFPVWFSLLTAAVAVVFALYVSLWSVLGAFWAAFGGISASALGGALTALIFALSGNGVQAVAALGASFCCAGIAIFAFFGCRAATKGIVWLTKKIILCIKKSFVKKETIQ
ncbi:MAG: DUF1700 domain-containing protein [Candidatus Neoclostridium sp.]